MDPHIEYHAKHAIELPINIHWINVKMHKHVTITPCGICWVRDGHKILWQHEILTDKSIFEAVALGPGACQDKELIGKHRKYKRHSGCAVGLGWIRTQDGPQASVPTCPIEICQKSRVQRELKHRRVSNEIRENCDNIVAGVAGKGVEAETRQKSVLVK